MENALGICNWAFEALADPACCAALRRCGISGVQLEIGEGACSLRRSAVRAAWRRCARAHGIEILSLMFNETLGLNIAAERVSAARRHLEEKLNLAIAVAVEMEIPLLVIPSFRASGLGGRTALARTADFLCRARRKAVVQGVDVASENILEPARLGELLGNAFPPPVRLYLDMANYMLHAGRPVANMLEVLLPLAVEQAHVKDGLPGRPGSLPLGEGEADIKAALSVLKQCSFPGWLVIENLYGGGAAYWQGRNPWDCLKRDILWLRKF